jgi:hypothetical protein
LVASDCYLLAGSEILDGEAIAGNFVFAHQDGILRA